MQTLSSLCLFAALVAAMLPGCRAKTSFQGITDPITVPQIPAPVSPFQIIASTAKTKFAVGEEIPLAIEIKNTSAEAVNLNFTSGQKFDFSATRVGEANAIWTFGMNKRFAQMLSTVPLEAGKTLRYETIWRGAGAGNYTIGAQIKAEGGLQAAAFEISIR